MRLRDRRVAGLHGASLAAANAGSRKAAEHAFEAIGQYLESELKLQVNRGKSAVARASTRDFLGHGLIGRGEARLKMVAASVVRLRQKMKALLRDKRGAGVAAIKQTLNLLLWLDGLFKNSATSS